MIRRTAALASLLLLLAGCGEEEMLPPPAPPTLAEGAPVSFHEVYASGTNALLGGREWIPVDLAEGTDDQLWVIQRLERSAMFDDETECTSRANAGSPHDCGGLEGSTVAIANPTMPEMADDVNGRANMVVDANSWHFMRRPSGIAFGVEETTLPGTNEGALDPMTGAPLAGAGTTFSDIFATCAEHWTGNFTDGAPFMGPSLWTAEPSIYNGVNGTESWSNGSHLDMVHATQYCMGIAWEQGNAYWVFNGEFGILDRYDFAAPHFQGHSYHDDAIVTRYELADTLTRAVDVPSNMMMSGTDLYIADSGGGRVVRFDTAAPTTVFGTFLTHESLTGEVREGGVLVPVASREVLAAEWGAVVEPSGLAFLDEYLVVGNHGSGHITLFGMDGTVVRTIDTGLGAGLAGLTVADGTIFFTHMGTRRVYRVQVDVPAVAPGEEG
ncbi:MAG: hypothetical protein AB8I08_22390 [Sandaracinaceae bacterium]